jgi:hypothetical protein
VAVIGWSDVAALNDAVDGRDGHRQASTSGIFDGVNL